MPAVAKRWMIAPPVGSLVLADLPAPLLVRQLLANRGLSDSAAAGAFLDPQLTQLHPPASLPGCANAAQRVLAAIRDKRRIVIYGDYDVDGITGSAILWHAIRLLGGDVGYYVPHRLDEGYGLNCQAIATLAREASMVITVDCGVTACEPAQAARALGLELIITDHHSPGEHLLPDAAAIVHPRVGGEYANPDLCGAGVALKLAWAVGQHANGGDKVADDFRELLVRSVTLAALGTVADVVPLIGENRTLVAFGLRSIKRTRLPGLDALIDVAGLRDEKVGEYQVGFTLAPRLNAAGRMDAAGCVVEMLTEASPERCRELAQHLDRSNRQRQDTEKQILAQAIQMFEADPARDSKYSIVLAHDTWHPGVVGIVAARMVERFCRPTILLGWQGDAGQGSGRTIHAAVDRFRLNEAIDACRPLLVSGGGHAMAGGVRVQRERFADFARAFDDYARAHLQPEDLVPVVRIDALATAADLALPVIQQVAAMAPFGQGNPRPVLACEGCRLSGAPRRVGRDGSHLQFHVAVGDRVFKAIAFSRADLEKPLLAARTFDLAFEPTINEFNGHASVEMQVRDVRF